MTFLSKETQIKSVNLALSTEEQEALVGLFSLLYEVDKRNNPKNYS